MSETPMMACGHSANATCSRHAGITHDPPIPACAICDCITVVPTAPDLTGRRARCSYYGKVAPRRWRTSVCTSEIASNPHSAFFQHHPEREFDEFYCGCWGWD